MRNKFGALAVAAAAVTGFAIGRAACEIVDDRARELVVLAGHLLDAVVQVRPVEPRVDDREAADARLRTVARRASPR